jgi:hypothetical protein
MTITGHVHGNTVTIDSLGAHLEEGELVKIIPIRTRPMKKDDIAGSWQDDRTAEEIIEDIRSSRLSSSREINL